MTQAPRSVRFRKERQIVWTELEELLNIIENKGLEHLSADQISRLPMLYRATVSSLNHARDVTLDSNMILYLESLVRRAFLILYSPRKNAASIVREFFAHTFPAAVRRISPYLLLATVFFAVGISAGWLLVLQNPEYFYAFVPQEYAQSRGPSSSAESLRAVLYDTAPPDSLAVFASFLVSNNAKIGMNCFAIGIAGGLPVLFLVIYNGLIIGAFMALYQSHQMTLEFTAWLLPHGITELFAVLLCAAGGLLLGRAVVFPGQWSRMHSLKHHMATAGPVVIGAVVMFLVAGLIEGFFRQMVQDINARWLFAASSALFWVTYIGFVGRKS